MRILFIAAEAEPFIKVGGLGDVAGALPVALQSLSDCGETGASLDVRLAIPFHPSIKTDLFDILPEGVIDVPTHLGPVSAEIYTTHLSGLPVYLIKGDPIAPDAPVYSSDARLDGEKYTFFSLAALELCRHLGWPPDILHANDWHTAPAVYALSLRRAQNPFFSHTHSVLSLHNLPFNGQGAQEALTRYGLPPAADPRLPEWAQHLPLPLGLLAADRIVAVSPTYAREILTAEYGCGLQDFLATRTSAISGILNGLDTEAWNPVTDPHIASRFGADNLSERLSNKLALQAEFNLQQDASVPLLALVSRMDPQKGVDITLDGLRLLADVPWQAIILGTGDPSLEESARKLEAFLPQKVRAAIRFDSRLSHRIYAGADIFMMPSRYEPCGLAQMAAMRYGCVPVASATGGLVDTVFDELDNRTGFLFSPVTPLAFTQAIERAISVYHDPSKWQIIQVRGMQRDYSWKKSARQYIELYQNLVGKEMP
jgi:starch synthase